MIEKKLNGANIRQDFINFFKDHNHTFVPSSSLVPAGDQTLLFSNAGMVQFKDIFLGIDKRPYVRAANSQKCMRVAGKHNDLDDVGRDDTHHTFFEMLGNWSFGDYYKKEAIVWAWELLTEVWKLPEDRLWATCFKDEKGEIPTDEEAANIWKTQTSINRDQVLFFGRKENFWEMAELGPCGPCSEIHIDRGAEYCNMKGVPGHVCQVNGDCSRFLELWNLVFIQYNRLDASHLEPLPACHVDTGMGFERIVSVLQDVDSNYKTDLFTPLMDAIQNLTGDNDEQMRTHFTPYRVIADHARAASFLIADGVVPGNIGRNYICRMIIRRAARFGGKIGLIKPFLAVIAEKVIDEYSGFYPELERNRSTIIENLTREEERFQRTLESGVAKLDGMLNKLKENDESILSGEKTFELYATYGLPFEITRDIAREESLEVDEEGFLEAMEIHRQASGAGEAFGPLGGEDVNVYRTLLKNLQDKGELGVDGVRYNPYEWDQVKAPILAMVRDGEIIHEAFSGEKVEIILPETGFYVESGGQVSDTGLIVSEQDSKWAMQVLNMRKPAAGIIVHICQVVKGKPKTGEQAVATVDMRRRKDITRNHTATHLLHAELRSVLGDHARQAGSLVAPDRLRFDFTHPQGVSSKELEQIETGVNQAILENFRLKIVRKSLQEAIAEGAIALFGEKYSESVRNITIGEPDILSNELCGGTHVEVTGDIGMFIIISEGSTAAGIRRIEAVSGHAAYNLARQRFASLKKTAQILETTPEGVTEKAQEVMSALHEKCNQVTQLLQKQTSEVFSNKLEEVEEVKGIPVLAANIKDADPDILRELTDRFRQRYTSGVVVLTSINKSGKPVVIAAVTEDLVNRGVHAGDLVKHVAGYLGGGGGGRPTLAQAGGKDPRRLGEALTSVSDWVDTNLSECNTE